MSTTRRTKTGCWTCRLRRKKCDESGLPCSNCSTRGVFCHGYGERPAWKDRGTQEKEEISRLQLRSRVRRKSRSNTFSSSADEIDLQFDRESLLTLGSNMPTELSPSTSVTPVSTVTVTPTDEHTEFEMMSALSLTSNNLWIMEDDPVWTTSMPGIHQELPCRLDNMIEPVNIDQQSQECAAVTVWSFPQLPTPDTGKRATELIMQFLGETFPLQHRSQHRCSLTHRSWVLNLLMKFPTFYSASLSMSALHLFHTLSPGSEAREAAFSDYHAYRSKALSGWKGLLESDSVGSMTTVEMDWSERLVCGVQIALLEAAGKNMQDAQSYLKSAAQCLAQHSELRQSQQYPSSTTPVTYGRFTDSSQSREIVARKVHPDMEGQALEFFSSLLIWNDILHCSVQKKVTSSQVVYNALLQDEYFASSFRDAVNCEAWIFTSLLNATSLDAWKRQQEIQGVLSIRELAGKGQQIESVVEEKLSPLLQSINDEDTDPHEHRMYTAVFAHALLIHLHCILSGSWPELPEIKSSIDKALDTWQHLTTPIDLRALAWPFLVTGSLATGNTRDWFRKAATEFHHKKSGMNVTFPWMIVFEECWTGFDNRDTERDVSRCDWRSVCRKHGQDLLFL